MSGTPQRDRQARGSGEERRERERARALREGELVCLHIGCVCVQVFLSDRGAPLRWEAKVSPAGFGGGLQSAAPQRKVEGKQAAVWQRPGCTAADS